MARSAFPLSRLALLLHLRKRFDSFIESSEYPNVEERLILDFQMHRWDSCKAEKMQMDPRQAVMYIIRCHSNQKTKPVSQKNLSLISELGLTMSSPSDLTTFLQQVYDCRETETGKIFAMKVVDKTRLHEDSVESVRREVVYGTDPRLQNPMLMTLKAAVETEGHIFMVMEKAKCRFLCLAKSFSGH